MRSQPENSWGNSVAEDLFINLFCEVFGPEKAQYMYVQYPFVDIYGNHRFIDFALESDTGRVAIEIDGETWHSPGKVSVFKYYDDLLKQNSMVHSGWRVFRWTYTQLKDQSEKVKDEVLTFLGTHPLLKLIEDYMPRQRGKLIELKDHQQTALENLNGMRTNGESIALLYHATGTGKTVTAVSDAKAVGKRVLFLAHTRELVEQAHITFKNLWPEASAGLFIGETRDKNSYVVCGSIQSVSQNLYEFGESEFGYLVIDECHHGTANTYQKVLSHFRPEFTLGLTATPERTDGNDLLEVFRNVAHKLDLKTAVELGELVPVRCIRIKTNIDLRDVRINGIRYNSQDLESKIFVPERNRIILDAWREFVKDRPTVIFCASVRHAGEIAELFREAGIEARSVSGSTKAKERRRILEGYEAGKIPILCACDLLNEGWDSPHTQVVFMARPTMSKTIYMQQLGRGMRNSSGKDCLFVFDFVDNANLFNMPYSLHRLLNLDNYRPGELVLAPQKQREIDQTLFAKGERPVALIDFPVSVMDYETVDLFNWQDEAKDMISQIELIRRVNVQSETIERYIREGKLVADLEVPLGEKRSFKYFREETLQRYVKQYGWTLITPQNMKQMFISMVNTMDMSASYKPVLLKAFFEHMDSDGKVRLEDVVGYFINYYSKRAEKGLPVEKKTSIFTRGGYTEKEVERLILGNPFKRFEDMRFMKHSRQLGYIELNSNIFRCLTAEEKRWIVEWCDRKLDEYYSRSTL